VWSFRSNRKLARYRSRAEFEADRRRRWTEGWTVRSVDERPRRIDFSWLNGLSGFGDSWAGVVVLAVVLVGALVFWLIHRKNRGTEIAVEYERAASA
jgi:hypothetical protein